MNINNLFAYKINKSPKCFLINSYSFRWQIVSPSSKVNANFKTFIHMHISIYCMSTRKQLDGSSTLMLECRFCNVRTLKKKLILICIFIEQLISYFVFRYHQCGRLNKSSLKKKQDKSERITFLLVIDIIFTIKLRFDRKERFAVA